MKASDIELAVVGKALRRVATTGDAYGQSLAFLAAETGYNASALRSWFTGPDAVKHRRSLALLLGAARVTYERRAAVRQSPHVWVHARLSTARKAEIAAAHAAQDEAKRQLEGPPTDPRYWPGAQYGYYSGTNEGKA